MWLLVIPLALLLILGTLLGVQSGGGQDVIQAQVDAELAQYRTFVYTAGAYFQANSAPMAQTAYSWDDIKAAASPAAKVAGMNPTWRAVRTPGGTWAACTELSEAAAAAVGKIFIGKTTTPVGTPVVDVGAGRKAMGIGSQIDAQASADLCKGV